MSINRSNKSDWMICLRVGGVFRNDLDRAFHC